MTRLDRGWLLATIVGSIVVAVLVVNRPLLKLDDCKSRSGNGRYACLEDYMQQRVDRVGIRSFLGTIDTDMAEIQSECHTAMHTVARQYAQKHAINAKLIEAVPANGFCSLGFVHGVTEKLLGDDPNNVKTIALKLCNGDTTRLVRDDCYHGLGHGLVRGKDSRPSVTCQTFRERSYQTSCVSGAYMERAMRATRARVTGKSTKVHDLCRDNAPIEAYSCWFYVPMLLRPDVQQEQRKGFVRLVEECGEQTTEKWQYRGCAAGAARQYHLRTDQISACESVHDTIGMQLCASRVVIDRWGDLEQKPEKLVRECSNPKIAFGCAVAHGAIIRLRLAVDEPLSTGTAKCSIWPTQLRTSCLAGLYHCWPQTITNKEAECQVNWIPRRLNV